MRNLQTELLEIGAQRKDGKFLLPDGSVAVGSDELSDLLQRCLLGAEIVLEKSAATVLCDFLLSF